MLQHIAHALACRHLERPLPEIDFDPAAFEVGAPLLRIPVLIEARRIAERVACGDAGELIGALTAELQQTADDTSIDRVAVEEGVKAGRHEPWNRTATSGSGAVTVFPTALILIRSPSPLS